MLIILKRPSRLPRRTSSRTGLHDHMIGELMKHGVTNGDGTENVCVSCNQHGVTITINGVTHYAKFRKLADGVYPPGFRSAMAKAHLTVELLDPVDDDGGDRIRLTSGGYPIKVWHNKTKNIGTRRSIVTVECVARNRWESIDPPAPMYTTEAQTD